MIRLNPKSMAVRHYDPPFPVDKWFGPVDRTQTPNEQAAQLYWIPATLVSRYIGQFPTLTPEADELFSVGVEQVHAIVHKPSFTGCQIGAVVNVQCRYHMEAYCNGLNSVVSVCTKTRYNNRNSGKPTPSHMRLNSAHQHAHVDDMTEVLLRDAAESIQVDLENLSLREKRALWDILS